MHFRQNCKAAQAVGCGDSHSQFIGLEVCSFSLLLQCLPRSLFQDWVSSNALSVKGKVVWTARWSVLGLSLRKRP